MALEYPVILTLEPVSPARLRAVLTLRGEVLGTHDLDLPQDRLARAAVDLSALVAAAQAPGRVVEVAAAWAPPMVGALTVTRRLRRCLADYRGPRPRRGT